MKTNLRSPLLAFWLGLLLLCGSANPLRADQFGLFTYYVIGGTQVTITDYPVNAVGAVTIPAQIAGLPVTSIGSGAFAGNAGLTSVAIPSSVTYIGDEAFRLCSGLTNVTIAFGVTSIDDCAFYGCSGLTGVTIPSSVTFIGDEAFRSCTGLISLVIPSRVTSIERQAFSGCSGLTTAIFLGDAPNLGADDWMVFIGTRPGFTIYYLSDRTGFSSPTWYGYPATMINPAIYPAGTWLVTHGYGYDADLQQDTDGDGVSLLMAYALDLDPRLNLKSSLPAPVVSTNTLSLTFHATSLGITYHVETSTDMQNWTTTGVTQSAPGQNNRSTATVTRESPSRFLRLKVAH